VKGDVTTLRCLLLALVVGAQLCAQAPAGPQPAAVERIRALLASQMRFDFGQSTAWLAEFQRLLQDVHRDPAQVWALEDVLIAFLDSDATVAARKLVADDTAPFVTQRSLPGLLRLLEDPRTSDLALSVLQRADLADGAALEAVFNRIPPVQREGVIRHVATRRDPARLAFFDGLLRGGDPGTAAAALAAIASLGTPQAAARLEEEEGRRGGVLDEGLAEAMLTCAERLAAAGAVERARALYARCLAPGLSDPVRSAAQIGLLRLAPDSWTFVRERLPEADPTLRYALIRAVSDLRPSGDVGGALLASGMLTGDERRHLLAVLAERGDPSILPEARRLLDSDDAEDREVALRALRGVGTADDVRALVSRAAAGSGPARRVVETALAALRSGDVDAVLSGLLEDARPEVRRVVLAVVRERGTTGLVEPVLRLTEAGQPEVRAEAIRTFGVLAGPEGVGHALERLERAGEPTERALWERVVVQLARKQPDQGGPSEALLARLEKTADEATAGSLVSVLGALKNPADLPVLQRWLRDGRRGVQLRVVAALGQWPDAVAADDLGALFAESDDAGLRMEALRGAVRLIGADRRLTNAVKRERLKTLLGRTRDGAERAVVLAGFGAVRDVETLRQLVAFMADPELRAGAEAAIRQSVRNFERAGDPKVQELLRQAKALSADDVFRAWVDGGP
jgi:hypothetical protein